MVVLERKANKSQDSQGCSYYTEEECSCRKGPSDSTQIKKYGAAY